MIFNYGDGFETGDLVQCSIHGTHIPDAAIFVADDKFAFICHNEDSAIGNRPDDLLGYKYGWAICCLDGELTEGVTDLQLVGKPCSKPRDQ